MSKVVRGAMIVALMLIAVSCKTNLDASRSQSLRREADILLEQEARITSEWTTEYAAAFNPQSRARFPANRQDLSRKAESMIASLDQSSSIQSTAAEKYLAASALEPNEKMRQFLSLFSQSFKTNVEINDLLKQQIGLVNDEEIKDTKTFEKQFQSIGAEIAEKVKDRGKLQSKGKEMIGIKQ